MRRFPQRRMLPNKAGMTAKRRTIPAQGKPRRSRNAEATKAALIASGEHVFASHGFEGATLDMVAARAGANKALVAYYFGSKEGLYDIVIATLMREVIAAVSARMTSRSDPAADFQKYVVTLANEIAERPTFPAILMREYVSGSMQSRKKPATEVLQFFKMTQAHYEAGRQAGAFRKVDPHMLHLAIVGPIIHFALTAKFRDQTFGKVIDGLSNPTMAVFASQLSRLVLNGLRRAD